MSLYQGSPVSTHTSMCVNIDQCSVIQTYNSHIFIKHMSVLVCLYLCLIFYCTFVWLPVCLLSYLSSKKVLDRRPINQFISLLFKGPPCVENTPLRWTEWLPASTVQNKVHIKVQYDKKSKIEVGMKIGFFKNYGPFWPFCTNFNIISTVFLVPKK